MIYKVKQVFNMAAFALGAGLLLRDKISLIGGLLGKIPLSAYVLGAAVMLWGVILLINTRKYVITFYAIMYPAVTTVTGIYVLNSQFKFIALAAAVSTGIMYGLAVVNVLLFLRSLVNFFKIY